MTKSMTIILPHTKFCLDQLHKLYLFPEFVVMFNPNNVQTIAQTKEIVIPLLANVHALLDSLVTIAHNNPPNNAPTTVLTKETVTQPLENVTVSKDSQVTIAQFPFKSEQKNTACIC